MQVGARSGCHRIMGVRHDTECHRPEDVIAERWGLSCRAAAVGDNLASMIPDPLVRDE
jgi:hypothetical protein